MGRTNRQRVKEWRERRSKEGGRSLSVWIEPETAKKLDELKEKSEEATSFLVARAIAALHNVTCNNDSAIPVPFSLGSPAGEKLPETGGETPPAVAPQGEEATGGKDVTCNVEERDPGGTAVAAVDDSVADIKATIDNNGNFVDIRERLAALLRLLIEKGGTYSSLMKELNAANLPTPEGEDTWRRSTIFALLR